MPKSRTAKLCGFRPIHAPRASYRSMTGSITPAEMEALRLSLEVAARSVLFSLPLAVLVAWVQEGGNSVTGEKH